MVHDVCPVGHRQRHVDVLFDEQNADPRLVGDVAHDRQQPLDDDRRQSEAHLIDHQHLRRGDDGPGHRKHLLLAAGQQAGLPIHQRA